MSSTASIETTTSKSMSTSHVLDNPAWAALTGPHAHFAERVGRAARYPVDVVASTPSPTTTTHAPGRTWPPSSAPAAPPPCAG